MNRQFEVFRCMKGIRIDESILDLKRHMNRLYDRQARGIAMNLKCTGCENLNWIEVCL
jgi:hypothetical protein